MEQRFRLSVLERGQWTPFRYAGVFGLEDRWLAAAPSGSPLELLVALLEAVVPPFLLELEVLEPEGLDAEQGQVFRLASHLDRAALAEWLKAHAEPLESDARLAVIVHGANGEKIVYDEHNRLLLSGPIEGFEQLLLAQGLIPGDPTVPFPHAHHYRQELTPALSVLLTR